VPEIVADVRWTRPVVTINVTVVLPAGTVADVGTCALVVLLLLKEITAPAGGAGPFRVKVPVVEDPPLTVFGLSVSVLNTAGLTVSVVVCVLT
jgi:hypothetical protein